MRILMMISKNDRYGAQRLFLDQVRVLRNMGNEVLVVTRGTEGYVTDSVRAMGISCHGLPMSGLRDLPFLRELVKQNDIDVIHTSLDRADYFGLLLSLTTRRPVVSTMNVRRYHAGYRFAGRVMVISRQQGQALRAKGVKPEKVCLVRPGIDAARFASPNADKREAWKQRLGTEQYSIVLNHISSLHPAKAHTVSLDMTAECRKRGESPLLLIVGDASAGEYYDSLVRKADDLGIRENVRFIGWTEDVPELLSLCHFTLLPSSNEALGMVLLEGMAAGTPVVARLGEGGAELVEEYGTGFLYNPEKGAGPLAEKLVALFRDKVRYRQFSAQCRDIAMKEFSLERFGERLMEVYEGLKAKGWRKNP